MNIFFSKKIQLEHQAKYFIDLSKAVVVASWLTIFNGDDTLFSITFFQLSFGMVLLLTGLLFANLEKKGTHV